MPTLIDRSGPRRDPWSWFDESPGAPPPAPGAQIILSLAQWQTHAQALVAAGVRPGVCLEPSEGPEAIAAILGQVALVAVRFPAFTDGRGYSSARLLRQRYGWRGELRAVGDILRDQLFLLARCGFDTFELADGESVEAAQAAFRDFTETYQGAADQGPLFRRRAQPGAAAISR